MGCDSFESRLAAIWPISNWRDLNVVVAVSGGADSVALLRALANVKLSAGGQGKLYVAHLNHGLRREAKADAEWVARLCQRLNLPSEISVAETMSPAARPADGIEAAARTVRYGFLTSVAHKVGARFVATAHTANDQVETVLQRILRGTGIAGLAGIPAARQLSASVTVVRPLLDVSRAEVEAYLKRLGQDFRVDESNSDRRICRNRLRHDLLPQLRADFNSDVEAAILRLARQADEAQQCIANMAREQCADAFRIAEGAIEIDIPRLQGKPVILVREACKQAWTIAGWPLQSMGFVEWDSIAAMFSGSKPDKLNLPGGIRAERRDDMILIALFA